MREKTSTGHLATSFILAACHNSRHCQYLHTHEPIRACLEFRAHPRVWGAFFSPTETAEHFSLLLLETYPSCKSYQANNNQTNAASLEHNDRVQTALKDASVVKPGRISTRWSPLFGSIPKPSQPLLGFEEVLSNFVDTTAHQQGITAAGVLDFQLPMDNAL